MARVWFRAAKSLKLQTFLYSGISSLSGSFPRNNLLLRRPLLSQLGAFDVSTSSCVRQAPLLVKMESGTDTIDVENHKERVPVEARNEETTERRDWPWKKAKKVAVMISFCGKDYIGMQRNPGFKTIEEELMKAFRDSGAIPEEWFTNMQQAFFQRASRTDKGVSAAKMIVSLKLLCADDVAVTIAKINELLPSDIRVQAIKRVTKNFNSKTACDARTYLYLTPTFAFAPVFPTDVVEPRATPDTDAAADGKSNDGDTKTTSTTHAENGNGNSENFIATLDFRMSSELREKVNKVLKCFVGPHYFHNYTSGKLPLEPSSQRFIYHFECGEPFMRSGMEFVVLKVKGQSFMLHQIRKMVGMTIAVVRGHASVDTIEKTWGLERIDIPRAPGLGLLLEEVHYDRYNKRFGKDGIHETLNWEAQIKDVDDFKEKFIYPEMIEGEIKEHSMFEWLKYLPIHTFEPRHFESDEPVSSSLNVAAKRLAQLDRNDAKRSKVDDDDEVENGGDDDDQ